MPTPTKYTKTIATDTLNGELDSAKLHIAIQISSIATALDRIDTAGGLADVWFKDVLSAGDQTTLTSLFSAHDGVPIGPTPSRVKIIEETESSDTGGSYQAQSFEVVVPASGGWYEQQFSFPFPISLFSAEWIHKSNMEGDNVEFEIAPDTITGVITADVAQDDTVISVQATVTGNAKVGRFIVLDDGTVEDMGRILSISESSGTLTMETPASRSLLASAPTYVKQTIKMVPHIHLESMGRVELGKDVIGGSYIPANYPLCVRYQNNEGTAKVFSFIIEYKY